MTHTNWLRGRTVVYNPPVPSQQPEPTWRYVIRRAADIFWGALRKTCIVIGAFFLFLAVMGFWAASHVHQPTTPALPNDMVLTLDLAESFPESSATDQYLTLLNIRQGAMTIDEVIDALHNAAHDPHVKALAVNVAGAGYDITQIQQIRAEVMAFRAAGKKAYIYAESYGEGGHGLGLYYLASAFDEIWMQPVGTVTIGGIDLEAPFFKGLMEKYGIQAQFFHRKEYKNAMEHLTADRMSTPSREMTEALVKELASQMISPIKTARPKLAQSFDGLLDLGLVTDVAAKEAGLIDVLGYQDALSDKLEATYKDAGMTALEDYWAYHQKKNAERQMFSPTTMPSVAVIHVNGMIVSGSSNTSPYGFESNMSGADDIADAIHQAGDDANVKAIVLRVNSPGGSPSASETIHRAVEWAMTKKKKPVIVSMGSMAASGGYWVAAGANKIYALDATLTGSIGVVGGKVNLHDFWDKFDIHWDGVKYGKNAGLMSMNEPFSESEQKQFESTLDSIYATFTDHVAKGRHMDLAKVESVAKGHVWTGREAVKLGLVDVIGGMDKVLDDIAKTQGVSGRDKLRVVHMPAVESPFDVLKGMMASESSLPHGLQNIGILSQMAGTHIYAMDPFLPTIQ